MKERNMWTIIFVSFVMSLLLASAIMMLHLLLEPHPDGEWQKFNCTDNVETYLLCPTYEDARKYENSKIGITCSNRCENVTRIINKTCTELYVRKLK